MADREALFFRTPAEWRAWLEANAAEADEVWVGLFKRGAGETGISWAEAVDQALCFGWIDGLGQPIDARRRRIRFTPRRARSIWSAKNIRRVAELTAEGSMRPAGLAAFAQRREDRSAVYSHEQAAEPELDAAQTALFEARPAAWEFFRSQPPSYRKAALWWVVSAKREETRERRLATLIADSAEGLRLKHLGRPS